MVKRNAFFYLETQTQNFKLFGHFTKLHKIYITFAKFLDKQ